MELTPQPKPIKPNWASAILFNAAVLCPVVALFYTGHLVLASLGLSLYLMLLSSGIRTKRELEAKREAEELKRAAENHAS